MDSEGAHLWAPVSCWLALHPKYQRTFAQCINYLFYGDGPLALHERHYVALMAAARHGCTLLLELHSDEYNRLGGEPDRLMRCGHEQTQATDPSATTNGGCCSAHAGPSGRYATLDVLNRKLAHRPWLVAKSDIQDLCGGGGAWGGRGSASSSTQSCWSLSELLQAAVILAHTHAVCSLVQARVINSGAAKSQPGGPSATSPSGGSSSSPMENGLGGEVQLLMERMRQLADSAHENGVEEGMSENAREMAFFQELKESQAAGGSQWTSHSERASPRCSATDLLLASGLTTQPEFAYEDFAAREGRSLAPTFKSHVLPMDSEGAHLWAPVSCWLALHPKYQRTFAQCINYLFYGDGPLALHERHYVALMAAARHGCTLLLELHSDEYNRLGGEPDRLMRCGHEQTQATDPSATTNGGCCSAHAGPSGRYATLDVLNRKLAHRPWLVAKSDIQDLCGGGGAWGGRGSASSSTQSCWSLSELLQAAVILAHTHAVCSLVQARVINSGAAKSQPGGPSATSPSGGSSSSPMENGLGGEVQLLMERMRQLADSAHENGVEEGMSENAREMAFFQELKESQAAGGSQWTSHSERASPRCSATDLLLASGLTTQPEFAYEDFAAREGRSLAPTFKSHDFSWDDQGYSVLAQLNSSLADSLDNKFNCARQLTYNTMGGFSGVDTTSYRDAVWNYCMALYGIRHDHYNYSIVNQMLSKEMKKFVKTLCCYPERASEHLCRSVMVDFEHSEKVHVVLLITEARLQAELLYFLRAVTRFLTAQPNR